MKRWFGPILRACGCCYREPPPPPPPPCWCDTDDCLGVYSGNFARLRVEINLDDSFFSEGYIEFLSCATTCRSVFDKQGSRWSYSGFSQFNGTYDIPFYALDENEEYVDADPTQVTCGVWFYPLLVADIQFQERWIREVRPVDIYGAYTDTGCATFIRETNRTLRVGLETRTGFMYIMDPVADYQTFGNIWPPLSNVPFPSLDPPVVQRRGTSNVFDCSGLGGPFITDHNLDVTRPWNGSPLKIITPTTSGDVLPIGKPTNNLAFLTILSAQTSGPGGTLGVEWDSILSPSADISRLSNWEIFPFGAPGYPQTSTRCRLQKERALIEVSPFDYSYPAGAGQQCNPFFPTVVSNPFMPGPYQPIPWRFASSGWRGEYRVLVN